MDPLARLVSHGQTEEDVMSNEHMSFDDIDATHVSRSMPNCELAESSWWRGARRLITERPSLALELRWWRQKGHRKTVPDGTSVFNVETS